ncbi:competence protein CoiA family protein [Ruegeria sp. HKCCD7318]|uniref:topoisomerase DNA-binding C4 zinc finger domain-containing protein n=1 Tax=Ruegeria sp. HKCCD7318 TaxID=2683014 RepID=UPI0014925C12|nr:competence protein CoiA family protein [Ruegeria sp. HKCCD7318]NOE33329.1 hypothetical protein [Ruegeria sp. HKCCD7318]
MRETDGRLVHVRYVQNGLKCGCICPSCKSPLIARQGKRRVWHFAHASDVNCSSFGETALHLAAKQTLKDLKGKIFIPEEVIRKEGWSAPNQWESGPFAKLNALMTHSVPGRIASESSVRIEPQDWEHQGFRPDAVLELNDVQLFIEILVTHEVDQKKLGRMRRVGIGAIEIDLSETDHQASPDELISLIVSDAPRKWLVTGRAETREKWENKFTKILKAEASRLNGMVPRDLTRHFYVNACPRRNEPDFESVDVYLCLDCKYCGGYIPDFVGTPLWNMLDDRLRHSTKDSVLCAYRDNPSNVPTEKQKDYVSSLARKDLEREGGLSECLPNGWEKDQRICSTFISAHPDCKKCGRKMALRRNVKEQFFWGCSNYPNCTGTLTFDSKTPLASIIKSHEQKQRGAPGEHEKICAEKPMLPRPPAENTSLSQRAMPVTPRPAKR